MEIRRKSRKGNKKFKRKIERDKKENTKLKKIKKTNGNIKWKEKLKENIKDRGEKDKWWVQRDRLRFMLLIGSKGRGNLRQRKIKKYVINRTEGEVKRNRLASVMERKTELNYCTVKEEEKKEIEEEDITKYKK